MNNNVKLEALLFWKGEPVAKKELLRLLSFSKEELGEALVVLRETLSKRGTTLLEKGDEVSLVTAPECSTLIEELRKEELSKDLGRAGGETLAIILYKGPVTRAELDYIRGVNSAFILRNLLIRGLIERISNPNDQRSYLYRPTSELYAHLGITKKEELPEFKRFISELESFTKHQEEKDQEYASS
ncbi:MAG: SMC-Scp complex subunit ScpB [Candidatus Paceibacterota bacterium]